MAKKFSEMPMPQKQPGDPSSASPYAPDNKEAMEREIAALMEKQNSGAISQEEKARLEELRHAYGTQANKADEWDSPPMTAKDSAAATEKIYDELFKDSPIKRALTPKVTDEEAAAGADAANAKMRRTRGR